MVLGARQSFQFCREIANSVQDFFFLAASGLFHMFIQSIKFYTFSSHILHIYRYLNKGIRQIDRKFTVAPFSIFY